MAKLTLLERQQTYENAFEYSFMRRVPIVISINGKGFNKLTNNIHKPFSTTFCKIMSETMLETATKMQGVAFAFTYSDKAIFILFNDQNDDTEPWLGNKLQDINSVATSLFTSVFLKKQTHYELNLDSVGDCLFKTKVFTLPNDTEVINYLIYRQGLCKKDAIEESCIYYLSGKFSQNEILKMLHGKGLDERKSLLKNHLDFDFDKNTEFHISRGIGAYKEKVNENKENGEEIIRRIWVSDWELPSFITDRNFIEEKIII